MSISRKDGIIMKTYIITCANSGLGFETAKIVAAKGHKVILACRNMEKGTSAANQIISETGNENVEVRQLDLASLSSVRKFAEGLKDTAIYALDNNAGISGMTEDGYDIVFQSNHLGHFLLTNLLLPRIEDDGRILNISSDMHNPPYEELIWKGVEILAHPTEEIMRQRYYYSKLCNLYFTYELCRKLRACGSHITVSALNPGFMGETNLAGGNMTKERIEHVRQTMPDRFGELPVSAQAAADILTDDCYVSPEALYYDRSTKAARSSELSYAEENAKELWEASLDLARLR
ncbi:MAG: SDR family NAD(P)-dependent oxidoreductase [Solobacterium sp.]|nr:SDR family NAD(P)-dependent oxidoreductase [Solobacterium sp.]